MLNEILCVLGLHTWEQIYKKEGACHRHLMCAHCRKTKDWAGPPLHQWMKIAIPDIDNGFDKACNRCGKWKRYKIERWNGVDTRRDIPPNCVVLRTLSGQTIDWLTDGSMAVYEDVEVLIQLPVPE